MQKFLKVSHKKLHFFDILKTQILRLFPWFCVLSRMSRSTIKNKRPIRSLFYAKIPHHAGFGELKIFAEEFWEQKSVISDNFGNFSQFLNNRWCLNKLGDRGWLITIQMSEINPRHKVSQVWHFSRKFLEKLAKNLNGV